MIFKVPSNLKHSTILYGEPGCCCPLLLVFASNPQWSLHCCSCRILVCIPRAAFAQPWIPGRQDSLSNSGAPHVLVLSADSPGSLLILSQQPGSCLSVLCPN